VSVILFQISTGTLMLIVTITIVAWFYKYLIATSTERMKDMMRRLALDPEIGNHGNAGTRAIMKEAQQRCRKCAAEDVCERWLVGDLRGSNTFCPNASVFRMFARAAEHTG